MVLLRLAADVEAPWATYGKRGDGLTPITLGALLREYDIRSANIRFPDGTQAKGYSRNDFADAWARYCPPVEELPTEDDGERRPARPSRRSPRHPGTGWRCGTAQPVPLC